MQNSVNWLSEKKGEVCAETEAADQIRKMREGGLWGEIKIKITKGKIKEIVSTETQHFSE